jgi:AraC-like DNA-binding protein
MFRTLKSADWFSADGFPIAVEWRKPQAPFPRHKHEFSEVVVVTGGKALHVVGKDFWTLAVGDIFVIGGPVTHEYREVENLSLINILFQGEKLKVEAGDLAQVPGYHALFGLEAGWRRRHGFKNRLHLGPRELGPLLEQIERLDREVKQREPGFEFMARALFMQIVGYLARCYGRSRKADSRSLLRIARVISHLESDTVRPVNLEELAALAGMSKRNLIRAFAEATGVTPIAYWIQLRINRGAALLRTGTEPITEVAFRSGFGDSNYFTRQFRKQFGVSPRQYRQQHSKG